MKTTKKILGVVLALIMVFNAFAMVSFAAFPDDTAVKLMIRTDKESYKPGETVTFTVSAQVIDEIGSLMIGGQYDLAYDDSVLSPSASTNTLNDHGFVALQAGYDAGISGVQMPSSCSGPADMYGWDATICYVVADTGVDKFAATTAVDLFTVTMVVDETAADGTYVMGFNPTGYEEYNGYINDGIDLGGLYGPSGSDYGFSVPNMYEYGTCEIKVASAVAESSPVFAKTSQIRYNGPVDGDYAPFDVRTRAAMTAEDFASICGTDAEAVNKITDIGFIYADSSVEFNIDDAKAAIAAKATTGAYVYAPVEHIQKTATEYVWTCLIEDAVYADAVNSIGYVVVGGETYVFDAAYATDFSDLYDTWSSKIPA